MDVNDHILLDCKLKDKDYLKDSDYLKDNDYNELLKQQQKKHIFDSDKIDISMTDDLKKVDSEINKLFDNTKLNIQMNICTNI